MAVPFKSDRPFQVEKFTQFSTEQMPIDVFRARAFSGLRVESSATSFSSVASAAPLTSSPGPPRPKISSFLLVAS